MVALSKADVNEILNRNVVQNIKDLEPSTTMIQSILPKIQLDGREYLQPVSLTFEHGITYGDDTNFSLNANINGEYDEIKAESNPVVMRTIVNQKAFNRLNSEKAVNKDFAHRFKNLKRSFQKRIELSCIYGTTGLGLTPTGASGKVTDGSGGVTVQITNRTWAAGVWSGMRNAEFDLYSGSTKLNTNAVLIMLSVDNLNKTITFSGNATDITNIIADTSSCDLFFVGSKTNDMIGLDSQITTQTGTQFNISKDDYAIWRGNIFPCGNTFGLTQILQGMADAVSIGGLDEGTCVYLNPKTFEDLNVDEAALRVYDESYNAKKLEKGTSSIKYHSQAGLIEIKPHRLVKEGEAFGVPTSCLRKVGSQELDFITDSSKSGSKDGGVLTALQDNGAYQAKMQYDWHVLIIDPAKCVKFTELLAN